MKCEACSTKEGRLVFHLGGAKCPEKKRINGKAAIFPSNVHRMEDYKKKKGG